MRRLKVLLTEKLRPCDTGSFYVSCDFVGDIAVVRVPEPLGCDPSTIAGTIMQFNRHVKTVLCQASPVHGDFRLRKLEWIAGERRTETVHREHGCVFRVDLEHCYFSPRLSHERMRIAQLVQQGEVVVNMFSGVGCFSVVISAHSRPERVYSIDVNPVAVQYLKENARLNKAERTIVPILGDAKEVIRDNLQNSADRVLMPLPEKAYDYLEYAISALKPNGGHINYYDFEHAKKDEDPIKKIEEKVSMKLRTLNVQFVISDSRIVRSVGPNWHQMVLDIRVSK